MTEIVSQVREPWDKEIELLRKHLKVDDKQALYHIERGRQGLNKGFGNGMTVLNRYIYGTHRARYYLVGADSGVGKTTLTDFMFVYHLWKECEALGVPLDLTYFSFEISAIMKKARWISLLYFYKYKEILPSDVVYGWSQTRTMTDDQYAKVKLVAMEVERLFDSIQFIESSVTPYRMFDMAVHRAGAYGDLKKVKGQDGPSAYVGYENKTPEVVKVTIVDHAALAEVAKGLTVKQNMDLMSTFFVRGRNLFGDTYVLVQQLNTELQTAAREAKSTAAYRPSRQDLGDSKYTFRDADVVLGLTRPKDYDLVKVGEFTKLSEWGDYFLQLHIMKNRYGGGMGNYVPLFMNPIVGVPQELPTGNQWTSLLQDKYIQAARTLDTYNT